MNITVLRGFPDFCGAFVLAGSFVLAGVWVKAMVNRHSQFAQATIKPMQRKETQRDWRALLPHLPQMQQLMLQLMYQCQLSTQQLTQLRLKDIDWQAGHINLYDQSLRLVRSVGIPESLHSQLKIQCMQVKSLWHADSRNGWVNVSLPQKVSHLQQALGKRQEWQFLFPASRVVGSYAASILRRNPMSCAALNNELARAGRIARVRDLANLWPRSLAQTANAPSTPGRLRNERIDSPASRQIASASASNHCIGSQISKRQSTSKRPQLDLFPVSA